MNKSSGNMFIDKIYGKKKKSFFRFLSYILYEKKIKKFKKNILSMSPSFDVLWQMANFIKLAEEIFFYDNNIDGVLYSSRSYGYRENGFKINDGSSIIVLKLYDERKKVSLEVKRSNGGELISRYTFKNSEWVSEPTVYDEMVLEQVIKSINKHIIELFDFCYNAR